MTPKRKPPKKVALRAVLSPHELLNTRLGKDSARARLGRAVMAYLAAVEQPNSPHAEYRVMNGAGLEMVLYWHEED